MTAIIAVLGIAVAGWSAYKRSQEEALQAAQESAGAHQEVQSTIQSQIDRIKELRQVLANTDSEQEAYNAKSELLSIQQQLTESYGAEAAGINLVNGELETQIGILQNLSKSKADAFLNENADAIAKAEKEMTKTLGGDGNWAFEAGEVLGVFADNQSEEVEKIKGIIEKYKDYLKVDDMQDGTFRIRFVGDATEAKTVLNDVMTDIRNAKDELGEGFYLDELFDNAGVVLEGANEILDKYQDIYEQAQAAKLISDTKEFSYGEQKGTAAKWINDYTKAVEDYNAALASGDTSKIDEAKNKFNALDTAVQSLLSNSDMSDYADDFDAIKEQLNTAAIAANSFKDALNGVNITDANRVISNFADTIKNADITDVDFKIGVENPSDDTALGAAISGITFEAERAGISVDSLVSMLGELGIISIGVGEEATSSVESLSGSLEDFYGIMNNSEDGNFKDKLSNYTEKLDTLKEALSDFNANELDDAGIAELMQEFPELTQYADNLGVGIQSLMNDLIGLSGEGETATGIIALFDEQIAALGENTEGAEAMKTLRDQILKLYDTAEQGFSFDITAEIGNMDNLFGAMSESYSPTGLSTESINNIKNMFSGMKGYDQSALFEHTANGIHLNSDALRELQAQYEATKKIGFQEELESLKQQYNDTKDELQSLTEGTEEYNQKNSELSDIEQRINDVSTLATQYEGLTSAYNKWIQAQSAGEEGDMYDQMRDGLEDTKELYEQGLIGTNAFRTYTDLLSSEDLSTADAYEVEAAYQKLGQTIEGTSYSALDFLAEGSDGCLNFLNATQQLNDEWVHMNEDGSWDIDFGVGGDKEVADALGIDVEYLQSIMRKLHDYGFDINLDNAYASVEELQSKIEKTEKALTDMGEEPVDIDVNAKDVDSEIEKAKEKIEEISESDVDVNVKDAQLADAQAKLDVLIQKKIQASQPSFMTIDVSQVDGNMQNTLLLLQNYQQAVNNLNALELKGADTSEIEAAKGEVDELAGQLASLDGDTKVSIGLEKDASVEDIKSAISADEITVPISADITSVTETIEGVNGKEVDLTVNTSGKDAVDELSGAIDALEGKTVEVKANVKGETQVTSLHNAIKALVGKIVSVTANVFGKSDVDALRESIRNTNSKTVTITTNRTTNIVTNRVSEAQGTAHANGTAFATGNISTKDSGIAFGGEVGQEMVVRDGKFFTIGDKSAEFFKYKKGDIIFNAGQTAQIFKYGKIKNGKKRGEAFADGTAFSRGSGAIHSSGRVVTVGSVNGGGSGGNGGSGGSGGNSKGKTAADAFVDWLSGLFDWAEIRLNRLNRLTEKWTTKAEQAVRYSYNQTAKDSTINKQYSNRASYTRKAITATENNIVGNQKAIASYNSMLNKIKSKGGLSAKTINKIKNDTVNGTFDIQSFDKDSKQLKAIQAYQEWYEKILDCTDAISELKETRKDLYDQLYNIPIEQATAKVEKYENAITRLNAAMSATSGGSKIYLRQTVRDAQTNFNSANTAADKTQKAYNSAKKTQDKAQKSFNSKKKTMSKTKGLSKSQKAAVKAGKAIDTKGLKGKALKNAEAYNKSLTALNKAKSATSSAKQSNSLAQANKSEAQARLDGAKVVRDRYANSPEYEYQNYLLDQETAQKNKENSAQQTALRTAKKNLSDAEKAKNSADKSKASKKKTVDTKSSSILKKYDKKLSKSQKADLKAGKEVSTKGLKGNALKAVKEYNKAVAAYKKSVASATDATTKYNSAVEAQATADQNAAVAQAEYTQAIQENAKAKFDNVATSFESKQSVTEAKISKLNTQLAYRTSMGYSQTSDNQKSVYNNAISENQNLLSSQKEELAALKNAYKENSANMSEQDANAAKAQITTLEESILSTQGTIADLQSELNKIEVKKLEIAMDRLKAKADSLQDAISLKEAKGLSATKSDYNALISNSRKQVTNLQAQNAELQKQQANYSTNSEKYQELQSQIEANEDAIRDAGQSQVEWNNAIATIPYTALENALDLLDAIASNNKSLIDLKSDSGNDLSASDYIQQMQDNNNQISKLEEERQQALADYRKALTDSEGVYGGKTADEWRQQYLKLGTEINGILSDNEKLKDSLRDDVYWREFDKAHDAAERLQDVIEGIADLISDDMIFDKDGKLTQYGIAQIANLTKEYENARTEVKNYSKDIENLNSLYVQGWYTENEYKEKLAELQKGVLDSAASMKDYSDTIIEMYKDMAKSELDALFELIDARNDALDAKADYYDYNKSITEKNRDIQNLNAEIAALEGIDTAEAKAKKAQLEADLSEKQEDLDDTVNDHMLELSQKALDDMKDVLQEAFDDRFEYISSNLDEIVSIMSAANKLTATSASTINSTLNKLLAHYGINANSTGIDAAYATGTTSVPKKLTGLFGEKGDEIAVMDKGLVATFNPGDGVVPSDLTKRLYDMAMGNLIVPNIDVPDITMPDIDMKNIGETNVTQHYDSLINIEGSADAATVEDIKNMKKELLQQSFEYTTKKLYNGSVHAGSKKRV